MEAAHMKAFSIVRTIVDDNILNNLKGTDYYNEDYRSEKLKAKLLIFLNQFGLKFL